MDESVCVCGCDCDCSTVFVANTNDTMQSIEGKCALANNRRNGIDAVEACNERRNEDTMDDGGGGGKTTSFVLSYNRRSHCIETK